MSKESLLAAYRTDQEKTEISPFNWESLKLQLEAKGMKFSIIQAEMPVEPPVQITSSVTNGIYPRLDKLIKKE